MRCIHRVRIKNRSITLHVVQIISYFQGRHVHTADCLWENTFSSSTLGWDWDCDSTFQKQLPAVQTILTDGVDKLGSFMVVGEGFFFQRQATKWDTKQNFPANIFLCEKSNIAAATTLDIIPTRAQKVSAALRIQQFIQFPCVVCTCALKHNSGVNLPNGSLSTIDCTT